MDRRKNIDKTLNNWDGLVAAIFITVARDDVDSISKQIKKNLIKKGYSENTIRYQIDLIKNDLKHEVAKYIMKEYDNYPYGDKCSRMNAFENRTNTMRKIQKRIVENINLKKAE